MNLFSIPQSVSRWLVIAGYTSVALASCFALYQRVINGHAMRYRVTPDGQLVLLTRREILQRRVMQTKKKLQDDPESSLYQDMLRMYERQLAEELIKSPPPADISDDDLK